MGSTVGGDKKFVISRNNFNKDTINLHSEKSKSSNHQSKNRETSIDISVVGTKQTRNAGTNESVER